MHDYKYIESLEWRCSCENLNNVMNIIGHAMHTVDKQSHCCDIYFSVIEPESYIFK